MISESVALIGRIETRKSQILFIFTQEYFTVYDFIFLECVWVSKGRFIDTFEKCIFFSAFLVYTEIIQRSVTFIGLRYTMSRSNCRYQCGLWMSFYFPNELLCPDKLIM